MKLQNTRRTYLDFCFFFTFFIRITIAESTSKCNHIILIKLYVVLF